MVQVPLEPQGTLHLSIRTVWLQHYDRSKSAQQQAPERSAAQPWGSSSDSVATTSVGYTDQSSVTSSMFGSYLQEADRATCESAMPPLPCSTAFWLEQQVLHVVACCISRHPPRSTGITQCRAACWVLSRAAVPCKHTSAAAGTAFLSTFLTSTHQPHALPLL